MSKAALLELADRAEKASGMDRELDVAICIATCVVDSSVDPRLVLNMRADDDDHGWVLYEYDGENFTDCAKSFTSSLDAAMTLVPEGYAWCVNHRRETQPSIRPNAQCWAKADRSTVHGGAATPALALTAACLRARAQQESKDA